MTYLSSLQSGSIGEADETAQSKQATRNAMGNTIRDRTYELMIGQEPTTGGDRENPTS